MVYCASKERFASSSPDCLEPRALDAAAVRCQQIFTGNFLMPMTMAWSRWARPIVAAERLELIRPQTSFTTPAEAIMSPSRFTNYGLLLSTENLLHLCGAAI